MTLIERIDQRLGELALTERAASMLATGNPDMIRDIRRKGYRPKQTAMVALAGVLETSVDQLLHGREEEAVMADRRTGYETGPAQSPFDRPLVRDVPVYGTAIGGDQRFDNDEAIESHLLELTEEIDWVRRPPMLNARRDVYALYITGHSMEPRFEPGDPVIVDPKRPPRPGDDVIVQLTDGASEEVKLALIKRLVRRTGKLVELQQYNPATTFVVPIERIKAIHRVIMMRDMIG